MGTFIAEVHTLAKKRRYQWNHNSRSQHILGENTLTILFRGHWYTHTLSLCAGDQGPHTHTEKEGGLNWSGVDPPLSSSRACLTTFIAISVP